MNIQIARTQISEKQVNATKLKVVLRNPGPQGTLSSIYFNLNLLTPVVKDCHYQAFTELDDELNQVYSSRLTQKTMQGYVPWDQGWETLAWVRSKTEFWAEYHDLKNCAKSILLFFTIEFLGSFLTPNTSPNVTKKPVWN